MADNKNDDNEHSEHEEEFGEDFDFESTHEDALAPEAHESGEVPGEDVQEVAPSTKPKNVMLPLVVGIIVLGFIGWKVYGILTTPKATAEGGPKEQQVKVAKAEPKSAPSVAPAISDSGQPKTAIPNLYEAEQQAKQAVSDEKITAILQRKIDEQMTSHKQQIDNLQKEVSNLTQNTTKSVGAMQQDVTALKSAMAELSNQLKAMKDAQDAQMARLEAERAAAKVKKVKPKPKITSNSGAFTNPSLTVHAIIPGRAWLRTPDGKTITVSEGDSISEYGKVLKIDAPNGLVITTSGVTLR